MVSLFLPRTAVSLKISPFGPYIRKSVQPGPIRGVHVTHEKGKEIMVIIVMTKKTLKLWCAVLNDRHIFISHRFIIFSLILMVWLVTLMSF